jgi:phosphoglycolate phosphatase-like HAD superfamily hydrolase
MIKAVIFDFDGVIVESAQLKTEAFRKLFSPWPEKVDEIVAYHLKHMGISRYVKFRYFYENMLGKPYTAEIEIDLDRKFSDIVLEEVKKASFVDGALPFFEKHFADTMLFIASGTPQRELDEIVMYKGIKKYFREVCGTPTTKQNIILEILKKYTLRKSDAIFVGDAESDKKAAENAGISFIIRMTPENQYLIKSCKYKIHDLKGLEELIKSF